MLNLVNWYRHKYLSIPSSTCPFIPPPIHSLSISISLPLSVPVYPPLSIYMYPSGYLSLYPFSMPFSLSFPLSALISLLLSGFLSPSIPPFILPTICLPFCLSITPLIYSSIRLSRPVYIPSEPVRLSIHPAIYMSRFHPVWQEVCSSRGGNESIISKDEAQR